MKELDEIREQIAFEGATVYYETWDKLNEEMRDNWRQWANDRILTYLAKKGVMLPTEQYGMMKLEDLLE